MIFSCTQENLHQGLLKVQGVAMQTNALPILKNILISAKENSFKLKSTDLEIGIITEVRGKVEAEGEICVEGKIFNNFISLLPQDRVDITTENQNLVVKCGVYQTKINTVSAEDFPLIPEVDRSQSIKTEVGLLKKAFSQVLPAVSADDTRPELNGIFFSAEKNILTIAGTDSYRLAERKVILKEPVDFKIKCIVPLKTVKELVRTFGDESQIIEIFVSENQVLFIYNQTEMVSRLIEGEYPDYTQVIPTSHKIKFILDREDFLNSVKISGLFAEVGTRSITLNIKPQKKQLGLFSAASSVGEGKTELNLTEIDGTGDLKIVFDYRYLLDGLNSIESEQISFTTISESSPVVLRPKPEGQDQLEQHLYIVMPIRQ
jgi:DNA polymerase-3 subunit beta